METLFKVFLGLWYYVSSVKKIFSKEFITERYYAHFTLSAIISIPISLFMILYMDLLDTPLAFQLFMSGFILFGMNFLREWVLHVEDEDVPFDWIDVLMGSYGGIVGFLILKFFIL